MRRILRALAVCAAFLLSYGHHPFFVGRLLANPLRTVALTGAAAPGTPAGVLFDLVGVPQIDNFGRTMFNADLAGSGVVDSNRTGVWVENAGGLSLVLREGDAAPGFPSGAVVTGLLIAESGVMNGQGDVVFIAPVAGGTPVSSHAIYHASSGGPLELVARTNVPMPQLGASLESFDPGISFNDQGQIAFEANIHQAFPNEDNETLWLDAAGAVELLTRTGDAVPDVPASSTFNLFGSPSLNERGDVAFVGLGVSVPTSGVFERRNGVTRAVAYEGMPAPGTAAGTSFASLLGDDYTGIRSAPGYNDAGKLAFIATLAGGGATAANSGGIWAGAAGELELIAREGDQAPGLASGIVFGDFQGFDPAASFQTRGVLDAQGNVSFLAPLRGPGVAFPFNNSIWTTEGGGLNLVARGGETPPGVVGDSVFGTLDDPSVNASGQIAFRGQVRDRTTNTMLGYGVWAEDRSGMLHAIAQPGSVLEVAPGDFRTVQSVSLAGTSQIVAQSSPLGSGLNDRGQVAFLAIFTDQSEGVFVSDLVAVPEPASWTLLGMVVAVGTRCRWRRVPCAAAA